ncbi:amidase [Bordetella trematum]|uniref:amidase n=1 Tax=Bordetella trematum TaxID=123899 RepID=UPI00052F3488|nr:amidase [Bordetella trematum]
MQDHHVQRRFADIRHDFERGHLTPRAYLEEQIARIASSSLRAFCATAFDEARQAADASTQRYRHGQALGPCDGMPVGIKDVIDTADMATEYHSRLFKGHRPRIDALCVSALRRGGALVVGKTATTEFAIGAATETVNPHDAAHTPGGSSSGAGAAVAAGLVPASLATQTQGSILRPASYCGAVGFKPTWGALSLAGVHPAAASQDHLGVIADSVQTAWDILNEIGCDRANATHGAHWPALPALMAVPPRSIRAGILRTPHLAELPDGALQAFDDALQRLSGRGVALIELSGTPTGMAIAPSFKAIPELSRRVLAFELAHPFQQYGQRYPDRIGHRVKSWIQESYTVSAADYDKAKRQRAHALRLIEDLKAHVDVLLLPASSGCAPRGLADTGSRSLQTYASFLGLPACSLPLMRVDGLPFGLQLIGFSGEDHRLASMAQALMSGSPP